MKKRILPLLFIISLLTACVDSEQINFANFPTLTDQAGNQINIADYQGKWLIINFWASWCGPCRKEIPELSLFYNKHHLKDAEVIGVNIDPIDGLKLAQLAKEFGVTYPITNTNLADNLGLNIEFMPTTVFINPQGILVDAQVKEQTVSALEAMIA